MPAPSAPKSTPEQTMISGLKPTDHEFLDLSQAQILKQPKKISENLVTAEQMKALQAAAPSMPEAPTTPTPAPPASLTTPISPTAAPATNPPSPEVPAPPTFPQDSPKVQDRINKLWGEKRSAEERAAEAERKYTELLAAQARLPAFSQVGNPAPTDSFSFGSGASSDSPPAGYISREEFQRELNRQTQELLRHQALTQAHTVSRSEAQRDFPDVFADPELEAAANRIWSDDKALREDPHGPYKAAALARGLRPSLGGSAQRSGDVPASLRKEALSGTGVSVPEGSGASSDRVARYKEAMARAARSGSEDDAVRALLIARGAL